MAPDGEPFLKSDRLKLFDEAEANPHPPYPKCRPEKPYFSSKSVKSPGMHQIYGIIPPLSSQKSGFIVPTRWEYWPIRAQGAVLKEDGGSPELCLGILGRLSARTSEPRTILSPRPSDVPTPQLLQSSVLATHRMARVGIGKAIGAARYYEAAMKPDAKLDRSTIWLCLS